MKSSGSGDGSDNAATTTTTASAVTGTGGSAGSASTDAHVISAAPTYSASTLFVLPLQFFVASDDKAGKELACVMVVLCCVLWCGVVWCVVVGCAVL
jgi:hypothetical protein